MPAEPLCRIAKPGASGGAAIDAGMTGKDGEPLLTVAVLGQEMNRQNMVPPSVAQTPALSWISRLVAFDTVSRNSNLALIESVRDDLSRQGFVIDLTYDAGGGKANLFATLPAADGRTTGGLVLSGHSDVVPVDGQDWSSDPFVAEVRNERVYGRGSADMKGFIGTALSLVPQMTEAPLKAPIHFALSFDEELACAGAPLMIESLRARGIRPEGVIVGEPTGMKVVTAHKGAGCWRCRVEGRAAHASLPDEGVSAITYAARLIGFINDMAARWRAEGPFDQAFDTPFSTAQIGVINGGTASNLIPQACEFIFEHRTLPGVDADAVIVRLRAFADELQTEMRRAAPEAAIHFDRLAGFPALQPDENASVVRMVRRLTGDDEVHKVAFGAEAGLFQAAGAPSLLCGPGHIAQAHKPDEYVSLDQLAACGQFLSRLIEEMRQ